MSFPISKPICTSRKKRKENASLGYVVIDLETNVLVLQFRVLALSCLVHQSSACLYDLMLQVLT